MKSNILWLPKGSESSLVKSVIDSPCFNDELVSSTVVWVFPIICVWRGSVPAAEAKKADDAYKHGQHFEAQTS